jgi:hypothetical protein
METLKMSKPPSDGPSEEEQLKAEEIFDAVNGALAPVLNRYVGHAPMLASAMVANLSYFISVTSTTPDKMLTHFSNILRSTDWEQARLFHNGFNPTVIKGGKDG